MGMLGNVYRSRARRVKPETARMRGDIGKILVSGLREATKEELYDRTTLRVTGRMFRSIQPRFAGAYEVAVGYDTGIAPHAPFRLAKRGRSKRGGHNMTMRPAAHIRRNKGDAIRERGFRGLKNILGQGARSG